MSELRTDALALLIDVSALAGSMSCCMSCCVTTSSLSGGYYGAKSFSLITSSRGTPSRLWWSLHYRSGGPSGGPEI